MTEARPPVLILGAGINGSAVARELMLNGVPVCLVEQNDIAWGATSRSSRLIHGGLRYLEYGEFRLVRESLEERTRLRRLAPQFVRPFSLHIPVAKRTGGLWRSALGFLSRGKWGKSKHTPRGLWLVRMGLWFYDRFVSDPEFPNSRVLHVNGERTPAVDGSRYRWLCRYTDAQMLFPERFVLSMLTDAKQLAQEKGAAFEVWTYHEVRREGSAWQIVDGRTSEITKTLEPALVVNATGAWGDLTLDKLEVQSPKLFGGTKGSHFLTHQEALCRAVGEDGVYAEADDGRLVFILPMIGGVMVGTTDERFEGDPGEAVASQRELDYLVEMVNELFSDVGLTQGEIEMHCAGVRPLPYVEDGKTSAISRDHSLSWSESEPVPILTLVGGKLTTARAFGETVADEVLSRLKIPRTADSRERAFPGGADYPEGGRLPEVWEQLARESGRPVEQIETLWRLSGTRVKEFLTGLETPDAVAIRGTEIPRDFVRWVIEHEWVRTLDDLIERRLMLVYHPRLTIGCLEQLADLLVEAGRMKAEDRDAKIAAAVDRLATCYGKTVDRKAAPGETSSPHREVEPTAD